MTPVRIVEISALIAGVAYATALLFQVVDIWHSREFQKDLESFRKSRARAKYWNAVRGNQCHVTRSQASLFLKRLWTVAKKNFAISQTKAKQLTMRTTIVSEKKNTENRPNGQA